MKKLTFFNILNSPLVRPRVSLYVGKVAVGTPYMLPRRWVKPTHEMAVEAAMERIAEVERFNERNAENGYQQKVPELDSLYKEMLGRKFSVPKRIGFDFVGLGYKTKWSNTDYRFEWCPIWSFVFFKWQIALTFTGPADRSTSHYWESWLYYYYNVDKTKSRKEQVEELRLEFPQTCTIYNKEGKETINYYDFILKNKYR